MDRHSARSAAIAIASLVVFSIAALALGYSWVEAAVAISAIVLLAYAGRLAPIWVERRTGRSRHPHSELYDATFYGIGLGLSMTSLLVFDDLHPVAFVAIAAASFTLSTVIAIAVFGSQTSSNEQA